jgi:hypothetical protein
VIFFILKTHFRIGRHENKEKYLFLELFFPSIANCKKLKIIKIQKSTSLVGNPVFTVPELCCAQYPKTNEAANRILFNFKIENKNLKPISR